MVPERVAKQYALTGGQSNWQGLDLFVQRVKNSMFGLADMGVFGVQMLTAFRRGGLSMVLGGINRAMAALNLPHMDTSMIASNLPRRLQNQVDGLRYGSMSAGVEPESGSLLSYLGRPGRAIDTGFVIPASEAMTRAQFDGVMGWVGDSMYEGQLMMMKLLGRDINNPAVRLEAANGINAAKSFGALALQKKRGIAERLVALSAGMTRAGIQNVVDMAKFLNPKASFEERIVAANLIASQAAFYLAVGYGVNEAFGVKEFQPIPGKPGFGQITLPGGRVISLFPQASFEKAVIGSILALKDGDEEEARNAWLRYVGARGSIVTRGGMAAAGVGYNAQGQFKTDLGAGEGIRGLAPVPPIVNSVATQVETNRPDALGTMLDFFGINNFPESTYSAEDRYAQETFNSKYRDLTPDQQAAVHVTMREKGVSLTEQEIASPYIYAASSALDIRQEQLATDPALKARSAAFLNAIGESSYDVTKYESYTQAKVAFLERVMEWNGRDRKGAQKAWDDYMAALELSDLKKSMQEDAIRRDPEIAKAVIALYNSGDLGDLEFAPAKWVYEAAEGTLE